MWNGRKAQLRKQNPNATSTGFVIAAYKLMGWIPWDGADGWAVLVAARNTSGRIRAQAFTLRSAGLIAMAIGINGVVRDAYDSPVAFNGDAWAQTGTEMPFSPCSGVLVMRPYGWSDSTNANNKIQTGYFPNEGTIAGSAHFWGGNSDMRPCSLFSWE